MREKLYRIKPLVWVKTQPDLDDCCGPIEFTEGHGYTVRRLHRTHQWYVASDPLRERFDSAEEAKTRVERDYASRLIAAGVVEPVEQR